MVVGRMGADSLLQRPLALVVLQRVLRQPGLASVFSNGRRWVLVVGYLMAAAVCLAAVITNNDLVGSVVGLNCGVGSALIAFNTPTPLGRGPAA